MKVDTNIPLPITAVSSVNNTDNVGNARQDVLLKLNQIAIGNSLQAKVISLLNDGSSLVQLQTGTQTSDAGSTMKMRLPPNFKVGDQLLLTLLSKEGAATQFSASLLTQQDTVMVSKTGQLLDQLISTHQQPKVNGTAPLLPYPELINPTHLSNQLNKTVDNSGVFYEAHLRQWNDGDRNLEQIRQEPQNQPDSDLQNSTNLIPTQLDTLEFKRFIWHGELWPGQAIDWVISKDDNAASSSPNSEQAPTWQTVLKLQLPLLGQVNATIQLQNDHVNVTVDAQDSTTAALLKSNTNDLANALAASGTTLDRLTVEHDVSA